VIQELPRKHTRLVLAGLSGLALLATLQPLLLPRQPRLPQLPTGARLPPGWRVLASTPARKPRSSEPALPPPPRSRAYRPIFSAMAIGGSTMLQGPDGALVRLTPLASWSAAALDPSTNAPSQPAPSKSSSTKPAPTCLTPQGTLESDQELLVQPPPKTERLPRAQRLLFTLLPARGRSFSCLLVSSNRAALLRPNASGRGLWLELSRAVRWPLTPGH
jgi:hypothetical protein